MSKKLFLSIVTLTLSLAAQAAPTSSGYDDIIRELTAQQSDFRTSTSVEPEETIRIHAGVGFTTSRVNLNLPQFYPQNRTLTGIEARLGIDLFSPVWVCEGAIRSFDSEPLLQNEMQLREFDLVVIRNFNLNTRSTFALGGGMTARYLSINGPREGNIPQMSTTGAMVMTAGFNYFMAPSFSLGLIADYRSAIETTSTDEGSMGGAIQLMGHF